MGKSVDLEGLATGKTNEKEVIKAPIKKKRVKQFCRYLGCDGFSEDPIGKVSTCSPQVNGIVLRRWTYARDSLTGRIKEGNGCHYCWVAHMKDEQLCKLSPKQVYAICDSPVDAHKLQRKRLEKAMLAVIQLMLDGKSKITPDDVAEIVGRVKVAEEKLKARMKFIRLDRLNQWRKDNPVLAAQHRIVLEQQECPLTRRMIQGTRVPVEQDGVYDLDVSLASQVRHTSTIDDGSLILSDQQMQEKFSMATEMQSANRGGISGSVLAADILGHGNEPQAAARSSSASAGSKRDARGIDDTEPGGEGKKAKSAADVLQDNGQDSEPESSSEDDAAGFFASKPVDIPDASGTELDVAESQEPSQTTGTRGRGGRTGRVKKQARKFEKPKAAPKPPKPSAGGGQIGKCKTNIENVKAWVASFLQSKSDADLKDSEVPALHKHFDKEEDKIVVAIDSGMLAEYQEAVLEIKWVGRVLRAYRLVRILPKDSGRSKTFLDLLEEDVGDLLENLPVWILQMKQRVLRLVECTNLKAFQKCKALGADALAIALGVEKSEEAVINPVQSGVFQQMLCDLMKVDKKPTPEIISECASCCESMVKLGTTKGVQDMIDMALKVFGPNSVEQADLLKTIEFVKEKGKLSKGVPGALCDENLLYRALTTYNHGKKILAMVATTASKKGKKETNVAALLTIAEALGKQLDVVSDESWESNAHSFAPKFHETCTRFIQRTTENAATMLEKDLSDADYEKHLVSSGKTCVIILKKVLCIFDIIM